MNTKKTWKSLNLFNIIEQRKLNFLNTISFKIKELLLNTIINNDFNQTKVTFFYSKIFLSLPKETILSENPINDTIELSFFVPVEIVTKNLKLKTNIYLFNLPFLHEDNTFLIENQKRVFLLHQTFAPKYIITNININNEKFLKIVLSHNNINLGFLIKKNESKNKINLLDFYFLVNEDDGTKIPIIIFLFLFDPQMELIKKFIDKNELNIDNINKKTTEIIKTFLNSIDAYEYNNVIEFFKNFLIEEKTFNLFTEKKNIVRNQKNNFLLKIEDILLIYKRIKNYYNNFFDIIDDMDDIKNNKFIDIDNIFTQNICSIIQEFNEEINDYKTKKLNVINEKIKNEYKISSIKKLNEESSRNRIALFHVDLNAKEDYILNTPYNEERENFEEFYIKRSLLKNKLSLFSENEIEEEVKKSISKTKKNRFFYDKIDKIVRFKKIINELEPQLNTKINVLINDPISTKIFLQKKADICFLKIKEEYDEIINLSDIFLVSEENNTLAQISQLKKILNFKNIENTDVISNKQRDIDFSFLGRICLIETPEGENTGVINNLTINVLTDINGFLYTPVFEVMKNKTLIYKNPIYIQESEIQKQTIINYPSLTQTYIIKDNFVFSKNDNLGNTLNKKKTDFSFSTKLQNFSSSCLLIPFLEHNDGVRILMGANMQKQALPLLFSQNPIVGTGIENIIAHSTDAVIALTNGFVSYTDSNKIIIRTEKKNISYLLEKNIATNENTFKNLTPEIFIGEKIKAGQILAKGFSIDKGELSLGKNIILAYTPWEGFNFEDSIVINENLILNDIYTSLHIYEQNLNFQENEQLNKTIITKNNYNKINTVNHSEENKFDKHFLKTKKEITYRKYDQFKIIKKGSFIEKNDILLIKSNEILNKRLNEKNKKRVYNEKKVLSDFAGIVLDIKIQIPENIKVKLNNFLPEIITFTNPNFLKRILKEEEELESTWEAIEEILDRPLEKENNKKKNIDDEDEKETIKRYDYLGQLIEEGENYSGTEKMLLYIFFIDEFQKEKKIEKKKILLKNNKKYFYENETDYENFVSYNLHNKYKTINITDLYINIYILQIKPIECGDKLSGRFGNKGIISKIISATDMPYLEDGTIIDILLNPLGIPSRMNLGQIYECLLGLAGSVLNLQYRILPFDENFGKIATEILINSNLKKAYTKNKISFNFFSPGKLITFDGRNSEAIDNPIVVGKSYIMKLFHLVEEKINARSMGPINPLLNQPIKGKENIGAQRFGEMETWALIAYGASYSLQEILTTKADNFLGGNLNKMITSDETLGYSDLNDIINILTIDLRNLGLDLKIKKIENNKYKYIENDLITTNKIKVILDDFSEFTENSHLILQTEKKNIKREKFTKKRKKRKKRSIRTAFKYYLRTFDHLLVDTEKQVIQDEFKFKKNKEEIMLEKRNKRRKKIKEKILTKLIYKVFDRVRIIFPLPETIEERRI